MAMSVSSEENENQEKVDAAAASNTRPTRRAKVSATANIANAATNRKRARDELSTTSSSLSRELSESTGTLDDSDFSTPTKRPRRKPTPETPTNNKNSAAKPARNHTVNQTRSVTKSAVKQTRTPSRPVTGKEDDSGSLYNIVLEGKASFKSVVDDWIDSYNADRDVAVLELVQFFFDCCGCKGRISMQAYADSEPSELIRAMTGEFKEDTVDYPLVMAGPQYKKFRSNMAELISLLIKQCQYNIIYDQFMMDSILNVLIGLTDSQVRAFRHTGTFGTLKLMTAIVESINTVETQLSQTKKQLQSERGKSVARRGNERLDLLQKKKKELEENESELKGMITYAFKGTFASRYRDIFAEIRCLCMIELGEWMLKCPELFLEDGYLKYIGWSLYDKDSQVRIRCLQSLRPLFTDGSLLPKLELFTSRFKERVIQMSLDRDPEVAMEAIRVACSVLENNEAALSDRDCETIYEHVFVLHRGVAQAAGEFLTKKLFKSHETSSRRRNVNGPYLRDLVTFLIESEIHEHAAYLVDALWELHPMVKDWECMTDLLLHAEGDDALDNEQETWLIEILACCARQAATGELPVGRGHRKLSNKEQKSTGTDRTKLTEHLSMNLPTLLAKYAADTDKLSNLLVLVQCFELDVFGTGRRERQLDSLLKELAELVKRHTHNKVLEECARALECLCDESRPIFNKCDLARSTLCDELVESFQSNLQKLVEKNGRLPDDELFRLASSLKRMAILGKHHDLSRFALADRLVVLLKWTDEGKLKSEELAAHCASVAFSELNWMLASVDSHSNADTVRRVRSLAVQLQTVFAGLLSHSEDLVAESAFAGLADLLVCFSRHLEEGGDPMNSLIVIPDDFVKRAMSLFIDEHVFVEEEEGDEQENLERMYQRRRMLAAYCRMITCNILPMQRAMSVFKQYVKFFDQFGDIIKMTISKCREISKIGVAKVMLQALQSLYEEFVALPDRPINKLQTIKELARKFALLFGLDVIKSREAIVLIHREGIKSSVSVPPEQPDGAPALLGFLDVLHEFNNKLIKQDKRAIVRFLDAQVRHAGQTSEPWRPFLNYRANLLAGDEDAQSTYSESFARPQRPPARRKRRANEDPLSSTRNKTPPPPPPPPTQQPPAPRPGGRMTRARAAAAIAHGDEEEMNESSILAGNLSLESESSGRKRKPAHNGTSIDLDTNQLSPLVEASMDDSDDE